MTASETMILTAEMFMLKMPNGKVASICRHIRNVHGTAEFYSRTWNKFWAGDKLVIWCCYDCFPAMKERLFQAGIVLRDRTLRN
jgi:hypothetical protein